MNVDSLELGELTCQTVDDVPAGRSPEMAVVLCHGYGAPGTDLVPVADEVFSLDPRLAGRARFIFPAAPHSLDVLGIFGGRAWWDINMERLLAAAEEGRLEELTLGTPDGLIEARKMLKAALEEAMGRYDLPVGRIVLGGFSQGAILTTDLTLHLEQSPAGLCIFSGMLLSRDNWEALAPRHAGLKVIQSHGRQDPILRYETAAPLAEMLRRAGLSVEFLPFDGPHTIPAKAVVGLKDLIAGSLSQ
jgi:phospholipase/carboxylesterase